MGALLLAGALLSGAAEANKSDDKPATHKLELSPFRVELKWEATVEPAGVHPVKVSPKVWTELTVKEAAAHGQSVKKGDVLLQLEPEKIQQRIRDSEIGLDLARLDLELAKGDLEFAEKVSPLELATVERAYRVVQQDLERYLKVTQPFDIKTAQVNLKSAADYLAYAEEELKQLKKMYKADDLTEETEEIILKRAQDSVDRARHSLVGSEISTRTQLDLSIPRAEEQKREDEVRQRHVLVRSKAAQARELAKKRLAYERQQLQHQKTQESLAELKADAEGMVVRAPAAGVVYHGSFTQGQWSGTGGLSARLVPGGKLLAGDTVMSIVEPRPLLLRALAAEKEIRLIKTGAAASAIPTADPSVRLVLKALAVPAIPTGVDKFELRFQAEAAAGAEFLMPGMTCAVRMLAYEAKQALAAPSAAVFEEGGKPVVFVKTGKGHRVAAVTLGRSTGGRTEILGGVKAGDVLLLERPLE